MTRQNLLIALLIASATLMGGALAFMPTTRAVYGDTQAANADYVLMTSRSAEAGDDSIIVLETHTGRLLTYQYHVENGAGRILLAMPIDLSTLVKPRP